jgi:SAM-dependent methyltransferase
MCRTAPARAVAMSGKHESTLMRDTRTQSLFLELFEALSQHGPGSDSSTRRALNKVLEDCQPRRILDIGCGAGRTSLLLAQETQALVTALDLNQPYLDVLSRRAVELGVADRIETLQADMSAPPVPIGEFDLIWSEGAIYVVGVEAGLAAWSPLLELGGRIAFTELSWISEDVSETARRFWAESYPNMETVAGNCLRLSEAGFEVDATFALPPEDWTTDFYDPLRASITAFRARHADDPIALAIADHSAREIEVFDQNPGAYSYVFYIASKRAT